MRANRPEVAPGLRLEDSRTVYLLDSFQHQKRLIQLQRNNGTVELYTKKSVLHVTISPSSQYVTLSGTHAEIQVRWPLHFYINPEEHASSEVKAPLSPFDASSDSAVSYSPAKAPLPWNRFGIVDVESRPFKRIVCYVAVAIKGGCFENAVAKQMTGGWVEITPVGTLLPGEYALVETVGTQKINLYVWDFGVNPKAPLDENRGAPQPASSTEIPPLQKR
jgi:hypothetical protein